VVKCVGDTRRPMTGTPTRFADSVALVTGSTRGIGAGIARRLADEGASVVVCGRSVEAGEATAETVREAGGDARFVEVDLRDPAAIEGLVEATVAEFGGLDVLVNNAGVETYTAADEADIDDWEFVVETDFRAYWLTAKHAVGAMDEGAVVNVSSNQAVATAPAMFPYNAVKAGINGMTRAMALDFGPRVRVNSVNPGLVAVDRTTDGMSEQRRRELASDHPVGRIGRPEDVAAAVAFLASDEAGYVTGTNLVVDGGRAAVMRDDALPDYRARREE